MKRMLSGVCGAILLLCAGLVAAQTQSAADIRKLVDKRVESLNEYQQLLADPDPQRALAAMQIMLESDDAVLQRMALDYGIYSPTPAVRSTALDALLKTMPALRVTLDGSGLKGDDFQKEVVHVGGSVTKDGKGFFSKHVGPFDAERGCYLEKGHNRCLFRHSDAGAAILLWNNWWPLQLAADGHLVGSGTMPRFSGVPISIPVTR